MAIHLQVCTNHLTSVLTNLWENASKKNKGIEWDGECDEAFRNLKETCRSAALLVYADFLKSCKLHTNKCTLGFGAILYQNQGGADQVIDYASSALSKTKHKYLAHKLEFLAVNGAIP